MRAAIAGLLLLAAVPAAAPTGAVASRVESPLVEDPAAICLRTADRAADSHGIPRAVLRALTRTETGRARGGALQPWPWTVNMEGAGRWFDSRAEALAYVRREMARGAVSFDVGCFQINHRWHGENFASVEEMFSPEANADYAARFLSGLHAETGDWSRAAGFYHSRTPKFVERYRARFDEIIARGDPDAPMTARVAEPGVAEPPFAPEAGDDDAPDKARHWRLAEAATRTTAGAVAVRLGQPAALAGGLLRAAPGPMIGAAAGPLLQGAARALVD